MATGDGISYGFRNTKRTVVDRLERRQWNVKPCRSYTAIITLLLKNIPLNIVHLSNISETNNEI